MPIDFALVIGPGEKLVNRSLALVLCRIWKQRGHNISVTRLSPVKGDCALLHIDTTRMSANLIPSFEPGMPVLNRRALDISKRLVSSNLVSPEDGYAGPVIVKTDDNAYGIPKIPSDLDHRKSIEFRRTVTADNWRSMRALPLSSYPILSSKSDVPEWVWTRSDIVVERFMAEMEGGLYVLRIWVFLGRREYGVKLYGQNPVVKSGNLVRYEYVSDVPESLRLERKRLGFDFGKFDYVLHDGRAMLLDANKTPVVSDPSKITEATLNLAEALVDMFPGRA
jgi:hypothetical protein